MNRSSRLRTALGVTAALLSGTATQAAPWRHGVIEPKSDAGFFLMATTQDFAKKHGLELQVVPLKNETLGLRALISGDLDSYEGSPPIVAAARGADVKVIGCPWGSLPHLILARTGIDTLKDLAGKNMATSSPGSMPDLVGRIALEQAGLAPGSVKLANVGSDSDRYRSLVGGIVDAAVISSEYLPIADMQKVHVLAKGGAVVPEFMRICYQTTAKTIAERPDDVVRFLTLEMDSLRYALDHKDATVALTRAATGQKPDDPRAAFMFDEASQPGAVDPTLPIPAAKFEATQQALIKLGVSPKAIDIAAIIDAAPREKALAAAGRQ